MLERIPALRIDLGQGTMREVEVDENGNWQSKEKGIKTTHIEGGDDQEDGVDFYVKYDVRDPYPWLQPKESYISGRMPPQERFRRSKRSKISIWKSGGEVIGAWVVYDARCRSHRDYPPPVDEEGNPQSISL